MSLTVEVKGVNFINKGAELMMQSIRKEVLKKFPEATVCMNLRSGSPKKIREAGFSVIPYYFSKKYGLINVFLNICSAIIPGFLRRKWKLVRLGEIDLILDASGFTYSDQWGYESMEVMHAYYKKMRQQGKKVVFMPQAFGPFEKPKSSHYSKLMFSEADLIFVRDKVSLDYVKKVTDSAALKPEPHPDFTNLLKVERSGKFKSYEGKVCLIPNYRMIDKGLGDVYFKFLSNCVKVLEANNMSFFFLIHETDNERIFVRLMNEKEKA
ncbi:MAG: polysaccharide pyruvyl transferase family protein, partial [Bacteroidota bacterium]